MIQEGADKGRNSMLSGADKREQEQVKRSIRKRNKIQEGADE